MSGLRFTLTIEGDVDQLLAVARAIEPVVRHTDINVRTDARPQLQALQGGATPVNVCSGGHGPMRLIPGGTAKSGPRIGQPYPAFFKCDACGERKELT